MTERISKTVLNIINQSPWGAHICQFYQTKEDLIEVLVPYFKAGLENNEFCMWVTSEPLKVKEAKASLKKQVKDLDDYLKKGQIEIFDASEWHSSLGKFEADQIMKEWAEKQVPPSNLTRVTISLCKKWVESGCTTPKIGDTTETDDKRELEKQRKIEELQRQLAALQQ